MLKPGRCKAASRVCSARLKKLAAVDGTRLGETVERPDASREVVQTGEVFEIATVAAEQDFVQVGEAVDRLSDGGEGAASRTVPMFYLAVVLESGDVVGGGLEAQDEGEFVVDLDRGLPKRCLTQVPSIRVAN